ncbi:FG-GAP and VCBS repeat-containing protein [Streptomyces flavofungini]|uniref:FG-GAP and VCBS repeat-containing protein n=1 Tax=Streptomyces flavofungini TaxID=68200 RepID=UPI0034E036AF
MAAATAAAAALTGGLLTVTATTASAAEPPTAARPDDADFNGDGVADLATSATGAFVSGKEGAGQVAVTYGGTRPRHVTYSQNSPGVPGSAEKGDFFGGDTAYGDFDRDGYDDLAIAATGEDVGSDADGGTVQILWGSRSGLSGGTTLKDPRPTKHDFFGAPIQAGDFNGDGKDDLAIGSRSGAATIDIYKGGLTRGGGTGGHYTVTPPIISGEDAGPFNLHSGDINADGKDDLIVDGFSTADEYNANLWLPGSSRGVTTTGVQRLPGGHITDVGDTDSDGYGDIIIGLTWDDGIAGAHKGGSVHVVKGNANGPYGGSDVITQDTPGVPGSGEKGDSFGAELDLGDINGDGHLDLVVGTPGENLDGVTDAGSITVVYGAADGSGLSTEGSVLLSQNTAGVPNTNEKNDFFGSDVHVDDLNDDGRGDIAVGALGENGGNGALYLLNSKPDGTLSGTSGVYTSTLGMSDAGTPRLGANFAD